MIADDQTEGYFLLKLDAAHRQYIGINNEVFAWLADDLQGKLGPDEREHLEDFLRPIYRENGKFACNCQAESGRVEYAVRKLGKSFRAYVTTPGNRHRPGCRLQPVHSCSDPRDKRLIDEWFPHIFSTRFTAATSTLGIESGLDARWLEEQSKFIWEAGDSPNLNIGHSMQALYQLIEEIKNESISAACLVGRYTGTKSVFKLRLLGGDADFEPDICGPVLDYRGPGTESGKHFAFCVLQLSNDNKVIATQASMFTVMTSGFCIPVRTMEIRWAIYTVAYKIQYIRKRFPRAEVSVEIRYDNGYADPTAIVLRLPAHPEPRIIAIRHRRGDICIPEALKPFLSRTQFIVQDPRRKSTLARIDLQPSHKKFKSAVLAELESGIVAPED